MSNNYDVRLRAELERLITQIGGVVPVAPAITNEEERTIQLIRAFSDRMAFSSLPMIASPTAPSGVSDSQRLWWRTSDRQLFYFDSGASLWLSVAEFSAVFSLVGPVATTASVYTQLFAAVPYVQIYLSNAIGFIEVDGGPNTTWEFILLPAHRSNGGGWQPGQEINKTSYPALTTSGSRLLPVNVQLNAVSPVAGVGDVRAFILLVGSTLAPALNSSIRELRMSVNYHLIA
jgi:hypothetical protein